MGRKYVVMLIEETYQPPLVDGGDYSEDAESVGMWEVECDGLRDVVRVIADHVGCCEPDSVPHGGRARWFTSTDENIDYRTGERSVFTAHLPGDMDARARRAVTYAVTGGGR